MSLEEMNGLEKRNFGDVPPTFEFLCGTIHSSVRI